MQEAESKVDPALKQMLTEAGAEDYIPVFALKGVGLKQLAYIKDKELSEVRGEGWKGGLAQLHRGDKYKTQN